MKKRVTGLGGVFYKTADPAKTRAWYAKHLGLPNMSEYGTNFEWRDAEDPNKKGYTAWSPFKDDTQYMEPSTKEFMINYRVEDLEGLLKVLKEEGVQVIGEMQVFDYGKFAHIMDLDGVKVELWEPNDDVYSEMLEDEEEE